MSGKIVPGRVKQARKTLFKMIVMSQDYVNRGERSDSALPKQKTGGFLNAGLS